jgi:hypothetical protein
MEASIYSHRHPSLRSREGPALPAEALAKAGGEFMRKQRGVGIAC